MNPVLMGRVLGSKYDDDGFLAVQIATFGSNGKSAGWFELSNSHGTQARPLDPDDVNACQAFYWYDGARGYAMLANDPRAQQLLPQSDKGEVFFHGPSGAFIRFKVDGSISLFTTDDNTTDGRSVMLTLAPTGLTFAFPFGRLTFDNTGFHVLTNSGARLDLGAITAPAPLNALASYATLSAAMVHVEGSAVHTGTATGAPQPVAMAQAVLTLATAVQGVLSVLETLGAFVSASPGSPAVPSPELIAAIGAANTALATATTTIPSVSSSATGV